MLDRKILISSILITSTLFATNPTVLNTADNNLKTIEQSLSYRFTNISKTDVNRIACNGGEIGKIVYSKDKQISIQKDGENAFVKLLPVVTRANNVVVDTVVQEFIRDVYIECNEKIYSLQLIPKDISAQTILLLDNNAPKKDNVAAKRFEKANSFEKMVIDIIKLAYKGQGPDGYTSTLLEQKTTDFNELTLTPTKKYEGNDFLVFEYKIKALVDIELDEKMFINFIVSNPLALSLTNLNLARGEEARLIVVSNSNPDPLSVDKKILNDSKTEGLEKVNPNSLTPSNTFNKESTFSNKEVIK